jgi:ppGpp synthetase/RelA/SpoT-type nucleotidyltranferase
LTATVTQVRSELRVAPTSRIKNTGTILEKLDRYGGSWLKSMHDIAGMRIVESVDRNGQDELVERVAALFADCSRTPRIVDRRATPSHGYRAVHVIVFPEDIAVEIQVRTRFQHEWADTFEKLADRIGRDIRYGAPPRHWLSPAEQAALDEPLRVVYQSAYTVRESAVAMALSLANLLDVVEEVERTERDTPELSVFRAQVAEGLTNFRRTLDAIWLQRT